MKYVASSPNGSLHQMFPLKPEDFDALKEGRTGFPVYYCLEPALRVWPKPNVGWRVFEIKEVAPK